MHRFIAALPLVLAPFVLAACAGGPKPPSPEALRAVGVEQTGVLLSHARETRDTRGCAAAAPGLRVVAAMGEGQEPAQHELGDCLLSMTGANATETALFREEGLFWLTRAAYAGNARAQRALAVQYGAATASDSERAMALKWALVYGRNAEADLYGFKALPATFVPGLKQGLPADKVAEAEAFAASFTRLPLAPYTPPAAAIRAGQRGGPGGMPGAGNQRRQPRQ